MNRVYGWVLVFALLGATGCSASSHDFNAVVGGVEQRYSVHAQRIPFMGLVSLCARLKTHGGVNGMSIAEFDHVRKLDAGGLDSLMQSKLGAGWQPMVKEWSGDRSSLSLIFVQPSGTSMRMIVADYDGSELDLVGMEMNGTRLAHWMQKPRAGSIDAGRNHEPKDRTD